MKMMKRNLSLARLLAILVVSLVGCTADYDTFDESDYRTLSEIIFEEQDGGCAIYASEHVIKVSLPASEGSEWDSVTIGSLDMSSLATLHLVDGKFKEFPSDSATLDSLAKKVSYVKSSLAEGDKIRIPQSRVVYLMVVSESGKTSIWQVQFDIQEKPKSSSSAKKTEESSSSTRGSTDKSSSSKGSSAENGSSTNSSSRDDVSDSGDSPKLLEIVVGEGEVAGMIDEESATVFFDMDYRKDLDLRSLGVKSIRLSEGASADIAVGEAYDFSRPRDVRVIVDGKERVYKMQAGYQYPGSDFNSWIEDDFGNKNDVDGWDNGNNDAISATKTLTVNEDEQVVKMESKNATILSFGRFASGNMLVAYFNPKSVGTLKLTGYDDGNELIDFGRPFYGRPKYVEFDVKYEGKGDSCDLYVILENRSRTTYEGRNQYRTSNDKNTLVASAWYRATTVDSEDDPDVVSIVDAGREGFKTIRLAFKYGIPDEASPIYNSSLFTTGLKNTAGIDNHVEKTDSPDDFDVTHIRVVMASSAQGNLYLGTVGATLWADEMRLIYEPF